MKDIYLSLLAFQDLWQVKLTRSHVKFERKICLNDMQYLCLCYGQLAMSALLPGFGFAFSMLDFIRDYLPQLREYQTLKST